MSGPKKVSSKKKLVSESIYESLRAMIAERRFKPGQRVNVEELARDLGVSRTPVWEAVRRLGQDGIFRNEPNRGVFMAEHPLERVRDRLQVRGALDLLAGRLACERISNQTLAKLSKCLPDQLRAIENSDVNLYVQSDNRFHLFICEAGGNVVLKNLYDTFTSYVLPTTYNIKKVLPAIYLVHQEIVAALSNGDPIRVENALTRHGEILIANLEDQIKSEADHKKLIQQIKTGQTLS